MDLVLFLSYFFPPLGGGGVQRSTKFAKYLPENGWQPFVLTVKPNRRNTVEQSLDFSLLKEVKQNTEIIRCKSFEMANLYYFLYRLRLRKALFEFERIIPFLHVDYKIGWYWPVLMQAKKVIEKLPIKLVYSSSPPFSSHFVALRLQKLYGLPWVADFRDPWTQIATYSPAIRIHRYLEVRLEQALLSKADIIIANTDLNKSNLVKKFRIPHEKISVIPNGFDSKDFERITEAKYNSSLFTISCVGKFYEMPDPGIFFRSYRALSDKYQNTFLRLMGWHSRAVRKAAKSILKEGTWEAIERVEHNKAILVMKKSSLLLVNLPNENCKHWIPGKLYEYLAARRPILLIGPEKGDAAAVIYQTRTGRVVSFDSQSIYEALEDNYNLWQNGFADWKPDTYAISKFDRTIQTKKLAKIFQDLSEGTKDLN